MLVISIPAVAVSGRLILLCGIAGSGKTNRSLPDGAPRIEPGLVAFWNDRIERPDAEELACLDPPLPLDQQGN